MWEKAELDRLYDMIFRRKSVRKYDQTALDQATLDSILQRAGSLTSPLPATLPAGQTAFRLLARSQIKGMAVKAPHYLAIYAREGLVSRANAAFKLQQIGLWLSAQGIGSVWLGMPNPASDVKQADGLPFAIMLGLGHPAEELHRKSVSEFKRKALPEITNLRGMEDMLEAVRLAPPAVNRQPWYLTGCDPVLRLHYKSGRFISKAMLGDMPQFDAGIALCHLWLAAEKTSRFFSFALEQPPKEARSGHTYVWTVNLLKSL